MRNRDVEKAGKWEISKRPPHMSNFEIWLVAPEKGTKLEDGKIYGQLFRGRTLHHPDDKQFPEEAKRVERMIRNAVERQVDQGYLVYTPLHDGEEEDYGRVIYFFHDQWWLE